MIQEKDLEVTLKRDSVTPCRWRYEHIFDSEKTVRYDIKAYGDDDFLLFADNYYVCRYEDLQGCIDRINTVIKS